MHNPHDAPAAPVSAFMAALIAVAGKSDRDALAHPAIPRSALHAEATVGLAILVTSLFAAVSSTVSMLMVLGDHPQRWLLAPAFGVVWATAIFCIDRALVISMDGSRHWGPMAVRMVLGVVIAVSVSLPIDIALFSSRVETQLREQRNAEMLKGREEARQLTGMEQAESETAQARSRLEQAQAMSRSWPPEVVEAMRVETDCGRDLEAVRVRSARQLADADLQAAALQRQLAATDDDSAAPDRLRALRAEIDRLRSLRSSAAAEIRVVARRCEHAATAAREAQARHRTEAERDRDLARQALVQAQAEQQRAGARMREVQADARAVAEKSLSNGFAAKAEALHRLVFNDPYVRWVYLTILIVWITLEMAPVIARGMTGRTGVDALLQAKAERVELTLQAELFQARSQLQRQQAIDAAVLEHTHEVVARNPAFVAELVNAEVRARTALVLPEQLFDELLQFAERVRAERGALGDLDPVRARDIEQALDMLVRAAARRVAEAI
jgi:hypothetical protein